ncbi:MAG: hypothetical protein Kow00120_12090 [Anaerolineae bacterium]
MEKRIAHLLHRICRRMVNALEQIEQAAKHGLLAQPDRIVTFMMIAAHRGSKDTANGPLLQTLAPYFS